VTIVAGGPTQRGAYRVELVDGPAARQIAQLQRNAHDATRRLNRSPVAYGQYVGDADASKHIVAAAFTAGQVRTFQHGLSLATGATPRGFDVKDCTGGYPSFKRTAWDEKTITIQSQNACSALFWVFA